MVTLLTCSHTNVIRQEATNVNAFRPEFYINFYKRASTLAFLSIEQYGGTAHLQ